MRIALLTVGLLCCLIGAEFLLVDKIVLHEGVLPAPEGATSSGEPANRMRTEVRGDSSQRHIDLPDSGGFVLIVVGVVCLLYFVALRKQRDKL